MIAYYKILLSHKKYFFLLLWVFSNIYLKRATIIFVDARIVDFDVLVSALTIPLVFQMVSYREHPLNSDKVERSALTLGMKRR